MLLNWLRDEKNQRLLAWMTAAAVAGWTLFVYVKPPHRVAPAAVTMFPLNAAAQPENSQKVATGAVQDQVQVEIVQKKTSATATDAPTPERAGNTAQSAQVGDIKDRAKVTIRQEQ